MSIPEDPAGRKRSAPKQEGKKPKKRVPSVVDTQAIGTPGTSAITSMYSCKKNSIVKEKTSEPEKSLDRES